MVEERVAGVGRVFERELEERGGVVPLADGPHSHAHNPVLEPGPEMGRTD